MGRLKLLPLIVVHAIGKYTLLGLIEKEKRHLLCADVLMP